MKNATSLSRVCKALSSETRVRIVQVLGDRVLCVGALAARLGVTQGAVSQHLRILREAGLVTAEKRGYYVHYRLNGGAVSGLQEALGGLLKTSRTKGARTCRMKRKKPVRSRKS